jgi:peptidyl-prolyl cis-trans isomerase D
VIDAGYGFDIVRVDDIQAAHVQTLDEVKAQIEPTVKQEKAAQAAEKAANALMNQARKDGLDKAAAAQNIQLVNTEFLDRGAAFPGIGPSPQFAEAVFQAQEKSPADVVQVPQGFVVYELQGVQAPSTPTFEEIRTRVETEFKNDRVRTLMTQKTQELSDRAKAEHDLKKAAKELGATMKTSELVLPDGQVPDVGSMAGPAAAAFTMKPGDISGPIETGNAGVVLTLLEKQPPVETDFATKKDEIREGLLVQKQNELFGLFASNVREQMEKAGKIKVNQDELKQLTRGLGGDEGE